MWWQHKLTKLIYSDNGPDLVLQVFHDWLKEVKNKMADIIELTPLLKNSKNKSTAASGLNR